MIKKVFVGLIIAVSLILFANLTFSGSSDHIREINDAFNCLDDRVAMTSISLQEAIFSALAKSPNAKINQTIAQTKSSSEPCWPNGGCKLKETAQVALAKLRMGENVSNITTWLRSKAGITPELTWYLQISTDDNGAGECVVNYDSIDHVISIKEDMKLSGNPGSCLAITSSGYWLRIAANCLDKEYSVQCNEPGEAGFKTNLLYEKLNGDTIYVSSQTHGASAGSWTYEEITAKCFKEGTSCDYEGSLWATVALYANNEEVSEYAPYLRALAPSNEKYFPGAFLRAIIEGGEENYDDIISSERIRPEGAYWEMSGSPYGKYYDTALAMLALGGADSPEIENAKTLSYLFEHQDENGCWNGGNIRDTAFIIYAAKWLRGEGIFECGDNEIDSWEACDGTDLNNKTCVSLGYENGTLGCIDAGETNECTFDVSGCFGLNATLKCGDGTINGSEVCDCGPDGVCTSEELGEETCESRGYENGTLGCSSTCTNYNVDSCVLGSGSGIPGTSNGTDGSGDDPYNPNTIVDCELHDYYCAPSRSSCLEAGGSVFSQETHACANHLEFCCTVDVPEQNCADLNGFLCAYDQSCSGSIVSASDGACCVGLCEDTGLGGCIYNSDCPSGKICDAGSCVDSSGGAECDSDSDCLSNEACADGVCVEKSGGNLWIWIALLLILIALVVLGIIYRDKLRVWWFTFRGKMKTSKTSPRGLPPPSFPSGRRPTPSFITPRPVPTSRPVNMGQRPVGNRPAQKLKKDEEIEETFRKLREMGK